MPDVIETSCRWRGGFCMEVAPPPNTVVIFGALGDLAGRKLIPSLYHLHKRGLLHVRSGIIACGRGAMSHADYREYIRGQPGMEESPELESFLEKLFYHAGDYAEHDTYERLAAAVAEVEHSFGNKDSCRVFYLATAPPMYLPIVERLAAAGLTAEPCDTDCPLWRHVVIEKPFGHDLESAIALEHGLLRCLSERQIYRIDHYLGKETVQNILMFRFANVLFEPVWNRDYIDSVQITAVETLGVEHRPVISRRPDFFATCFRTTCLKCFLWSRWKCRFPFPRTGSGMKRCAFSAPSGRFFRRILCLDSMRRAAECPLIARNGGSLRNPIRKPMRRPGCISTTGAGMECLFISGAGNA